MIDEIATLGSGLTTPVRIVETFLPVPSSAKSAGIATLSSPCPPPPPSPTNHRDQQQQHEEEDQLELFVIAGHGLGKKHPKKKDHLTDAWLPIIFKSAREITRSGKVSILSYTARGHGESHGWEDTAESDPDQFTWRRLPADMLALADHYSIPEFVAAGSSMGAATSLFAAIQHPTRIRGVVMIRPQTAWSERRITRKKLLTNAMACQKEFDAMTGEKYGYVLKGTAHSDLPDPITDLEEYHKVVCPVLILTVEGDPAHPVSTAQKLHELLPQSELFVALTNEEAISQWPSIIATFLSSLLPAASAFLLTKITDEEVALSSGLTTPVRISESKLPGFRGRTWSGGSAFSSQKSNGASGLTSPSPQKAPDLQDLVIIGSHGLGARNPRKKTHLSDEWLPVISKAAREVRSAGKVSFISYTARGHGKSHGWEETAESDPAQFTWVRLPRDMLAMADHYNVPEFVAAGSSMSAATSLFAAMQFPTRIRAVVMIRPQTAWHERRARRKNLLSSAKKRSVKDAAENLKFNFVLRGTATSDLPDPLTDRDEYQKVRCPVLILGIEGDTAHPVSTAVKLHELLPQSELFIAKSNEEANAQWPSIMASFLTSLLPAAAPAGPTTASSAQALDGFPK